MARKSKYEGAFKTGDTFGHWTVINGDLKRVGSRENGNNDLGLYVRCVCGTERTVAIYTLKNGKSTNCGCQYQPTGSANPNWKGIGVVPKTLFANVVNSSGGTLSAEYVSGLASTQSLTCAISGQPLSFSGQGATLTTINPANGFVPGNVTWVASNIAPAIQHQSLDQYLNQCKQVLEFNGYTVTAPKQATSTNPLINACLNVSNKHK